MILYAVPPIAKLERYHVLFPSAYFFLFVANDNRNCINLNSFFYSLLPSFKNPLYGTAEH